MNSTYGAYHIRLAYSDPEKAKIDFGINATEDGETVKLFQKEVFRLKGKTFVFPGDSVKADLLAQKAQDPSFLIWMGYDFPYCLQVPVPQGAPAPATVRSEGPQAATSLAPLTQEPTALPATSDDNLSDSPVKEPPTKMMRSADGSAVIIKKEPETKADSKRR